jgi:DNA repair photolyase
MQAIERRWVDRLARMLLSPLLSGERISAGWRVLSWDAEQGLCLTLARGECTLLIELERRDASRDCYARTERFNVCARRVFAASSTLGEPEHRVLADVLAVVRAREGRLPAVDRAPAGRRAIARRISVDRVLIPEGPGHYYLNPYVGCTVGCEWCYVAERADFSRELEGLPRVDWGRWVDVKDDAPAVLAREAAGHPPGIVRLSPIVTDPYQPIERCFRVTRRCLEVLLEHGFTPCILTRGARVLEDLPLLRRFPRAAVGFSIPTDDDAVRRVFEPGADPIEARVAALARFHAAGVRTFAVIQPVLPGNPGRLAAMLAPIADAVRIDHMYFGERARASWAALGVSPEAGERICAEMRAVLELELAGHGIVPSELDDLAALFSEEACVAQI